MAPSLGDMSKVRKKRVKGREQRGQRGVSRWKEGRGRVARIASRRGEGKGSECKRRGE